MSDWAEVEVKKKVVKSKTKKIDLDDYVTKETAAREVYVWVKKGKLLGMVAIGAPFAAGVFAFLSPLAGATMGLIGAGVAAFWLKQIVDQIKYLESKYDIVARR